jgi:glycyl-tRNA synthetase
MLEEVNNDNVSIIIFKDQSRIRRDVLEVALLRRTLGYSRQTDFNLKAHHATSGQDMSYFNQERNERYVPYCIEPSLGADRVLLAFLIEAYDEEKIGENDTRVVLRFHPSLAPIKSAVLPLTKKLSESAQEIYNKLSKSFMCDFDESGSIGKRYRRQDEIGTPFCITVDFNTETDDKVTVRHRDTMEQERVAIDDLAEFLKSRISGDE